MDRRKFLGDSLKLLGMLSLSNLNSLANRLPGTDHTFPMMFVGHGNPMNAIEDNAFSREWMRIGAFSNPCFH
jgi:4,5-DOPA dioxygenase extradiol